MTSNPAEEPRLNTAETRSTLRSSYWRAMRIGVYIAAGPALGVVFIEWLALSAVLMSVLAVLLMPFVELPALLLYAGLRAMAPYTWAVLLPVLVLLSAPRTRHATLKLTLSATGFLLVFVPSLQFGIGMRSRAFAGLADRSAPLVEAIRHYQAEQGHPPPNLEALVPEYFRAVPRTGIGAYPDYIYATGEEAHGYYCDCEWVLEVPCGGFLDWDTFLYFPGGEYPEYGFGGWLERVGDWAYVHE